MHLEDKNVAYHFSTGRRNSENQWRIYWKTPPFFQFFNWRWYTFLKDMGCFSGRDKSGEVQQAMQQWAGWMLKQSPSQAQNNSLLAPADVANHSNAFQRQICSALTTFAEFGSDNCWKPAQEVLSIAGSHDLELCSWNMSSVKPLGQRSPVSFEHLASSMAFCCFVQNITR